MLTTRFLTDETVQQRDVKLNDEALKNGGLPALFTLWAEQPDGFYVISLVPLSEKKFHDVWFEKRGNTIRPANGHLPSFALKGPQAERYETYFCVAGFSKQLRRVPYVLPSKWLFADLDYVPPHEIPFPPSFSWQTSPGKWQCVWYLKHYLEPQEFRHVNRAINHACGADPGTWNINRLLRAPGSEHLKEERAANAS